jgi:hypothetical protein
MIVVGYFIYKKFPFYIEVNKTFWCKRIYSFTLMMYTRRDEYASSAKGLFTLPVRNYKKIEEWDKKMHEIGKHRKYSC